MHLQTIALIAGILSPVLGILAFVCIIWPAIRRQNRLGDRIEALIDHPDSKTFVDAAKTFIADKKKELLKNL